MNRTGKMRLLGCLALVFTCAFVTAPKAVHAENWAILIGVNDYNEASDLRYCDADQQALKKHLVKGGFDERQVVVMSTNAENKNLLPTHSNIMRQLEVNLNLVQKGDIIVFGFSGHGVQIDGKDYLCPSDTVLNKKTTLIPLEHVYESLRKSGASMKLMLVDACKNEVSFATRNANAKQIFSRGGGNTKALGNEGLSIPNGIMLLSSCSQGEMSYEDPKLGHGVWMHYVLEGLRGKADKDKDGKVSVVEIALYTARNTGLHVRDRFNGKQKPFSELQGENGIYSFNVAKLDYQPIIVDPSPNPTPPKKTVVIGEAFKAEMDLAMKADGIDSKIEMFGKIIADSSYSDAELKLARSFRMKLLTMRSKPGDLKIAIKDAKATGKDGIPVTVKKDSMQLAYSEKGKAIKTSLSKGEVMSISQMDSDSFWVISVDGDKTKKGWINKNKLFNEAKKLEVETNNIPNVASGSGGGNYYPGDNFSSYGNYEDELKAFEQELKHVENALKNPFNGLNGWERAAGRRELEQYKRMHKQAQEQAKQFERQQKIQQIFGGGRGGGIFGGGF